MSLRHRGGATNARKERTSMDVALPSFATLTRHDRIIRRYQLHRDERGYYWQGMTCASWRRKTRASVDRHAERAHFDVTDYVKENARTGVS